MINWICGWKRRYSPQGLPETYLMNEWLDVQGSIRTPPTYPPSQTRRYWLGRCVPGVCWDFKDLSGKFTFLVENSAVWSELVFLGMLWPRGTCWSYPDPWCAHLRSSCLDLLPQRWRPSLSWHHQLGVNTGSCGQPEHRGCLHRGSRRTCQRKDVFRRPEQKIHAEVCLSIPHEMFTRMKALRHTQTL